MSEVLILPLVILAATLVVMDSVAVHASKRYLHETARLIWFVAMPAIAVCAFVLFGWRVGFGSLFLGAMLALILETRSVSASLQDTRSVEHKTCAASFKSFYEPTYGSSPYSSSSSFSSISRNPRDSYRA